MTRVKLTSVRAFPGVKPTKEQALKVLEEAAEVVEICGDGPMPRNVAQACSFKFRLAREIRKAIR